MTVIIGQERVSDLNDIDAITVMHDLVLSKDRSTDYTKVFNEERDYFLLNSSSRS